MALSQRGHSILRVREGAETLPGENVFASPSLMASRWDMQNSTSSNEVITFLLMSSTGLATHIGMRPESYSSKVIRDR